MLSDISDEAIIGSEVDAQVARKTIALVELEPGERLSDLAYTRILESLFDRRLPAGAFVSQNDLVQLIGVPVGPLRDALRVLEAEGILTIHPRRASRSPSPAPS